MICGRGSPAANVLSVGDAQGSAPVPSESPMDCLEAGREDERAVLKDTTLADGCTYRVSMPSAAPISAVGGRAVFAGVLNLGGTVKERFSAARPMGVVSGVLGVFVGLMIAHAPARGMIFYVIVVVRC